MGSNTFDVNAMKSHFLQSAGDDIEHFAHSPSIKSKKSRATSKNEKNGEAVSETSSERKSKKSHQSGKTGKSLLSKIKGSMSKKHRKAMEEEKRAKPQPIDMSW